MNFIKIPVKGMRDFLPDEMKFREYILNIICETYSSFGFNKIETPCVEHIENLTSKQGGDNEKLIFKILKRGEKLDNSTMDNISDMGLRYDLTVPLARYYANNMNDLNFPFKALQVGNVWRADRPQKGRFRQFTQCDIDILGDKTSMAEINLLIATSTLLSKLSLNEFTIHINDRRILKSMAIYAGFNECDCEQVFISLDKIDKVGLNGVKDELIDKGFDLKVVEKYLNLFESNVDLDKFLSIFNGFIEEDVINNLKYIIEVVSKTVSCKIKFDPTLVRGMSYYTGVIFEVKVDNYNSSIAGGGRYDNMIEKYINVSVPACGFSIGFERLIDILKDNNYKMENVIKKKAILISKNIEEELLIKVFKDAEILRNNNYYVNIQFKNKNYFHQKELLEKEGYEVEIIN